MRIGIDARYAFHSQRRGIGQYVAEILSGLARIDTHDTFVLYVDVQADTDSLALPKERFQIRRLSVRNPMVFEEIALPMAAKHDRLDLLHLTSNYGPSFPPCPTVYTIHDLIEFLRDEIGPWQVDWRHRYGRAVRVHTLPRQARHARAIVVPSAATQRDVSRILEVPKTRVWTIPFGAPHLTTRPPEQARARLRVKGYTVPNQYVMAFAALDPRKNWRLAVQAFGLIHESSPDAELWLVGIEDPATCPINRPWLRVTGYIPRDDVIELLQGASAFVYPSLYEGFGFPLLEAMVLGVPVIASNRTSVPEVVGDAGLIISVDGPTALADGILYVLGSQDVRDELSRRGRLRAAAFRWQDTVERHLTLYHTVGGAF